MSDLGPLAAALAKAQVQFAPVKRDKEVVVKTKTGGEYRFKYAPLDSILDAVRKPLSDNGLVVVQMLDDGDLITSLVHESGAAMSGRVGLPNDTDIQGLGSAITYLRRYAIQALLGIAAEDDDDGNRAVGNRTEPTRQTSGGETTDLMGIDTVTGVVKVGGSERYKAEWRPQPDGSQVIGFALARNGDKDLPQVGIMGPIADALFASGESLVGQKVTVRGSFYSVRSPGRTTFVRVIVGQRPDDFIETPEVRIPPAEPVEAPSVGMFEEAPLTDEERAAIAGGVA